MRYEGWDILLFPQDCKVPFKEFKVACHVVHDTEFSHAAQGSSGLPTVCCFVPSLPAGTPFQISMHSWTAPKISQFTRAYSKYPDTVTFEARLFVDGHLVASTALSRESSWPHVIANSFDFSKNGELGSLKFPSFRQELLQQNYWSPADDIGRIKIVISEGFPRDSVTMPIERVKNIAAFSFQHAPLEILESSAIAWPNPSMWRKVPFTTSMPVPSFSSEDTDSHAHSPRRRPPGLVQNSSSTLSLSSMQDIMPGATAAIGTKRTPNSGLCSSLLFAGATGTDMFGDANQYFEWLDGIGMGMSDAPRAVDYGHGSRARTERKSNTDTSMPDYGLSNANGHHSIPQDLLSGLSQFRHDDEYQVRHLKVPTNTPTAGGHGVCATEGVPFPPMPYNSIPDDVANSLTNSLLNQSMPAHLQPHGLHPPAFEVRSRKENRRDNLFEPPSSSVALSHSATQDCTEMRKVSQQLYISPGNSVPVGAIPLKTDSPQTQPSSDNTGQRTPSMAGSCISGGSGADVSFLSLVGQSIEKGTKRTRNFSFGPGNVIDEEDEPKRGSPRVRLTPFVEDVAVDGSKSVDV